MFLGTPWEKLHQAAQCQCQVTGRAATCPSPQTILTAAAAAAEKQTGVTGRKVRSLRAHLIQDPVRDRRGVRWFYMWILVFSLSWGGEWRGREGRQAARGHAAKQSAANVNHTAGWLVGGRAAAAHLLVRHNAVLAGRQAVRWPGQCGHLTLQVLSVS